MAHTKSTFKLYIAVGCHVFATGLTIYYMVNSTSIHYPKSELIGGLIIGIVAMTAIFLYLSMPKKKKQDLTRLPFYSWLLQSFLVLGGMPM